MQAWPQRVSDRLRSMSDQLRSFVFDLAPRASGWTSGGTCAAAPLHEQSSWSLTPSRGSPRSRQARGNTLCIVRIFPRTKAAIGAKEDTNGPRRSRPAPNISARMLEDHLGRRCGTFTLQWHLTHACDL